MKVIIILLVKKNEAARVYLGLQMSFYYKSSKSSLLQKRKCAVFLHGKLHRRSCISVNNKNST